ncbi:hypothetical protein C0993_010684, partial [Termitomyces sp. T159_Od127]
MQNAWAFCIAKTVAVQGDVAKHLLAPRWAEAVVDMGVEVGVVLKETKGKATVDLATRQAFKKEKGHAKTWECGNTPNPTVEKTYHWAVLVRRAQAVVEKAWEATFGAEEGGGMGGVDGLAPAVLNIVAE